MIIFDTRNNYDGKIKGMLYISLMDADYLVSTYGLDKLKDMIPLDYAEHFASELEKYKKERTLSSQYYAVMGLGIESEDDERLLDLLRQEVEMGNLFTKSQLSSITEDEIDILLAEARKNYIKDEPRSLYKLRSYMMSQYIMFSIGEYNKSVEGAYEGVNVVSNQDYIMKMSNNWESMGISSDIEESDYFKDAIELAKKFKG